MNKQITRRKFVIQLSTGATALAAAPKVLEKKSDKIIRIGIVGGRFGATFQWHEHPNCKVTVVCDIRKDRLEKLKTT